MQLPSVYEVVVDYSSKMYVLFAALYNRPKGLVRYHWRGHILVVTF